MLTIRSLLGPRARDQRGFTLMETLVAMLTGIVVTGALFAILEVSLRQTARLTDAVQVNQLGRGTMTRVIDELRSSCLSPGFAPIQSKSTPETLYFVTAFSSSAVISKTEAFEHKIAWSKAGQTLTDTTYPSTSGEWPKFEFSLASALSSTRIGERITKGELGGKETPIFRYYKYAHTPTSGTEAAESTLTEIPLTAGTELGTAAAEVASVNVAFKTSPIDKTVFQGHVPVEFSNQTTLAFSSPASESTVEDKPCH
jgi:type II secretory pathway pseudopilin PulG